MTTYTEPTVKGDVLVEAMPQISVKKVTVASGSAYQIGTVLGAVTATGVYTTLAPSAEDGSQTAAGICLSELATSAAAQSAEVLIAIGAVRSDFLVWPSGITDVQKAAALAALETKHIIAH